MLRPLAPLKTILLSDGVPGHYHLAEGVLAAIERRRPLEVARIEIRRHALTPGRLLAALLDANVGPEQILRLGYGLSPDTLPPSGLVVSAGGDTLAANISVARRLGATNIFFGSLRRFRPESFSLVLTSDVRNAGLPRHAVTLKPAPADPDAVGAPAAHDNLAVAGLLIGGNTARIKFGRDDWTRLAAFLDDCNRAMGTRWIVSNSRRTPKEATEIFARLAARNESPVLRFIDVESAGPGTLGDLFAQSAAIFCTIDSSSMVSETVWMRRPVITVAPEKSELPAQEVEYRRYLESSGWSRCIPIRELSPPRARSALSEIVPVEGNPLERLASLLAERVPQLYS